MKKAFTLQDMEKKLIKTSRAKKAYDKEYRQLKVAHQIAELREQFHMTQKELAKRLHTRQQVVSRIEQDNYKPSFTTLEKIAEVFDRELVVTFR